MADRLVINSGPLIALARIEALDVVGKLPIEYLCPAQVREELDEGISRGYPTVDVTWLQVVHLAAPLTPVILAALDEGEAAVVQFALEAGISHVCLDDLKGRRTALAVA